MEVKYKQYVKMIFILFKLMGKNSKEVYKLVNSILSDYYDFNCRGNIYNDGDYHFYGDCGSFWIKIYGFIVVSKLWGVTGISKYKFKKYFN